MSLDRIMSKLVDGGTVHLILQRDTSLPALNPSPNRNSSQFSEDVVRNIPIRQSPSSFDGVEVSVICLSQFIS